MATEERPGITLETADESSPLPRMDDKGILFYGSMPVGRFDGDTLVLNLGWMSLAGMHVKVHSDPEVDRTRGGVEFQR